MCRKGIEIVEGVMKYWSHSSESGEIDDHTGRDELSGTEHWGFVGVNGISHMREVPRATSDSCS
jgi:hypothetical protein